MNFETFKNTLESIGLGKYYESIQPLLRNAIRLQPHSMPEGDISLGQTKIGGLPDLPDRIEWPTEAAKPLSFIAQLNLSEIALFDLQQLLPDQGMLYFFYATENDAWASESNLNNKLRVIYSAGDTKNLIRTVFPSDLVEYGRYKACAVDMESEVNFPNTEEFYELFTDDECYKFNNGIGFIDSNINKILGYADDVQGGAIELECGNYDTSDYETDARITSGGGENWRLLLQIDSNIENNIEWGDMGRLYFLIRDQDLIERRFDKSRFYMSSY